MDQELSATVAESSAEPKRVAKRSVPWLLLKLAVTGLAIAYVAHQVDLPALRVSFSRLSATAAALAVALFLAAFFLGAVRFRLILGAYGADKLPGLLYLYRLYLIGLFYNTFLPGAVAGDVVRGVVVRSAFSTGAATSGLAVVFIERIMGLLGLFMLVSVVTLWHPFADLPGLSWFAALGALAALVGVWLLAHLPRIVHLLPRRLAAIVNDIPSPRAIAPLFAAVLVSMLTHAMVAVAGHGLLQTLHTRATLADSLVVIPTAAVAIFIPVTVAGAGVSEAAYVGFYGHVHVASSDALVVALGLRAVQAISGLIGGVLALVRPI
jgi:glycosyltransferase 2 family protein